MTLMDVAHDFAVVSILLAIGYFLRMKVKLFQRLFLPASIIGGLIGLIIGPQILGLYSPVHVTYTASISEWSAVLLAVTLPARFWASPWKKLQNKRCRQPWWAASPHQAQAVLGMIVAFLFQSVVPIGFGLIPLFALYGGIGWSVPVATIFEEEGYWTNAVPVAITIATIGVVCGIVFGIVMVNIGIRKGLIKHTTASLDDLPEEFRTGYIALGKRPSIGSAVSKSSSVDPFTLQLAFVGLVVACALWLRNFLISIDPFWENLPLLSTSLFCSGVFGIIIGRIPALQQFIDRDTIERISNVSLEYLITSAVATTSIEAFVSYLLPIVVISVVVIAATTWVSIFFSKRWCPQDWFASAVAQYGAYMGLLSTGLLLAKVVDPDHKTVAAETVAASCTLGYSYSLPYLLIMPMLVISSPKLVFGISVVLLIVFLIAGEVFRKRARVSN